MTREKLKELQDRVFTGTKKIQDYDEKGLYRGFDWRKQKNVRAWLHHKSVSGIGKCTSGCDCGLIKIERWIMHWVDLFDELAKEGAEYMKTVPKKEMKHSKGWNMMKRQEAIEKWKHTLKAKRGPDPRYLPLETFT